MSRASRLAGARLENSCVRLRHRKKFKVTTTGNPRQPVFDNRVQRQFDVPQTDPVYASDPTCIWTPEGW
ncbi:MAG: hypothetical protein ACRESZ_11695 [Methylococcales bacterium]